MCTLFTVAPESVASLWTPFMETSQEMGEAQQPDSGHGQSLLLTTAVKSSAERSVQQSGCELRLWHSVKNMWQEYYSRTRPQKRRVREGPRDSCYIKIYYRQNDFWSVTRRTAWSEGNGKFLYALTGQFLLWERCNCWEPLPFPWKLHCKISFIQERKVSKNCLSDYQIPSLHISVIYPLGESVKCTR